jgi:hypothetical protein|tara:strand:- start:3064 stop:3252 length:189 start_codon:yes stop_codon:yes gene_type:complete
LSVSLFTRKHYQWLAENAVNIDLNKKQIDRLIEELVKTNPNFKPSTFRSAITIYRNASSGGI